MQTRSYSLLTPRYLAAVLALLVITIGACNGNDGGNPDPATEAPLPSPVVNTLEPVPFATDVPDAQDAQPTTTLTPTNTPITTELQVTAGGDAVATTESRLNRQFDDSYTIQGQAGQTLRINYTTTITNPNGLVYFALQAPDGELVWEREFNFSVLTDSDVALSQTGQYLLLVDSANLGSTDAYGVSWEFINP